MLGFLFGFLPVPGIAFGYQKTYWAFGSRKILGPGETSPGQHSGDHAKSAQCICLGSFFPLLCVV